MKNEIYYQDIKYIYSDYIFNYFINKHNYFLFKYDNKINIINIFNKNCILYKCEESYLKKLFTVYNSEYNFNVYKDKNIAYL